MATANLSSEVVDVLSRATVSGNVLTLPPGQLDRNLYEAVNKALTNAGGKWKRGTGHVFPGDAAPKLAAMLGTGVSVDEKKRDQAFFTPQEVAERVADLLSVSGEVVLEPSAGCGALAAACMAKGADSVHCFELNHDRAKHLHQLGYEVTEGDFLEYSPARDSLYQRIAMNPPFTANQDIKHVNHAIKWLAPDGILVAIMLDNQTRTGFQEILARYDPKIIPVERGAFKESGTNVPTVIVKITAPTIYERI